MIFLQKIDFFVKKLLFLMFYLNVSNPVLEFSLAIILEEFFWPKNCRENSQFIDTNRQKYVSKMKSKFHKNVQKFPNWSIKTSKKVNQKDAKIVKSQHKISQIVNQNHKKVGQKETKMVNKMKISMVIFQNSLQFCPILFKKSKMRFPKFQSSKTSGRLPKTDFTIFWHFFWSIYRWIPLFFKSCLIS